MKKTFAILITLLAIMIIATPVFAGKWVDSQKADFYLVTGGSSDNVTSTLAGGGVTIVDPMGNVALIIQGNVKGLTPLTTYAVWVRNLTGYTGDYISAYLPLGYYKLAYFTTDELGDGSFHLNLRTDFLPDATYSIQVAINDMSAGNGITLIATQKYMTVTVESH